jgi:hypothetical protein
MTVRLGRLPANPAALARQPEHKLGAMPVPMVLDRRSVSFTPGLYHNDTIGDCTVVSIANMIGACAALNGYQAYIDGDKVLQFFADAAGNPPDLAAVDGLVYLDVVNRQAQIGFDTGHDRIFGLPGTVGLTRMELAAGMNELGAIGIGVLLKAKDMATVQQNMASSAPLPLDAGMDDGAVIGGHAEILWDYTGLLDDDLVRTGTWGYWQTVTWRWVSARIEEAHGLRFPQLAAAPAA